MLTLAGGNETERGEVLEVIEDDHTPSTVWAGFMLTAAGLLLYLVTVASLNRAALRHLPLPCGSSDRKARGG
ncbi:hypothetical protein GCM10022225_71690 [Plantactinospora mayteni]|uniref:Uncharacterized protein n=1 Tax=Plantactinospora mayteni TaxID=566021 RepID=A0ABQ4F133_9ACTN|nr:hypothetical protein [Plantactinospora mayteni]GIH00622.1 hypothetical protein Pma05_71940 [Plantactinospora mayteni]